jgi:GNAT superfamily N-acetyltransferase
VTSVTTRPAPGIHVRRYHAPDAQACADVVRAAVTRMEELDAAARTLILDHATVHLLGAELARLVAVVAEHGDAIVGVAALDEDEIKRVYVHPSAQQRGAGRAMIALLEREAADRGLREVHVVAGVDAAPFYTRLGYQRLHAGVHANGDARVPFVSMRKALAGAP